MLCALTFDFWGTLYQGDTVRPYRLALLGEALAGAGQARSPEDLEAAYAHCWRVLDRLWLEEHRSITVERWLEEMLLFLRAEVDEAARSALYRPIQDALLEHPPRLVPGVREVLPRLARRFRLGLISDVGLSPGRVLRELLRRDGLLDCFRVTTFSDESGVTKPLPEAFLRTLAALDVPPAQAAHIGDLPETDLAGARGVGMRAVLFLGVSHREDGLEMADAAFVDYAELEDLLRRLG